MSVNVNTAMRWHVLKSQSFMNALEGKRVCDLGAGLGFFSVGFKHQGAQVTAIDVDQDALNYLSLTYGIATQVKDVERDTIGAGYDLIFIGEILEHIHDPADLIQKSFNSLNKEGLVVLTTPALEGWLIHSAGKQLGHTEGSEKHERDGFSERELQDLLKGAGFQFVHSQYTIFLMAELFMQITKRAYMKSRKTYHSQSDVLDITRNFKYKLLKFAFPVLILLFKIEEFFSRALGLKGHCHVMIGRKR